MKTRLLRLLGEWNSPVTIAMHGELDGVHNVVENDRLLAVDSTNGQFVHLIRLRFRVLQNRKLIIDTAMMRHAEDVQRR